VGQNKRQFRKACTKQRRDYYDVTTDNSTNSNRQQPSNAFHINVGWKRLALELTTRFQDDRPQIDRGHSKKNPAFYELARGERGVTSGIVQDDALRVKH
jgi:hypothetical protein